jgi:hypothetical protein
VLARAYSRPALTHVVSGLAVNFLLIESLQRFYQYYGDEVQIECPTGSGDYMNLLGVAEEIQHRIIHIFGRDMDGRRATNGGDPKLDFDPHFRDYVWFYEVRRLRVVFNNRLTVDCSSSTATTAVASARLIRRDGASARFGTSPRAHLHCQVGPSCLPYPAERRDVPSAEDAEEYVRSSFTRTSDDDPLRAAPRSLAQHYFDESIDEAKSEYGDNPQSLFSARSAYDLNTLGDVSPDAL